MQDMMATDNELHFVNITMWITHLVESFGISINDKVVFANVLNYVL